MGTWLIEWGLILLATWTGIPRASSPRPLTFEDRVRAQEAIERVYYEHRIWPKENPGPKPPFEEMISRAQIEAKVEDYLKKSVALDKFWQRPIQPEQLQAELNRMAKQTQDPETLNQLFSALDNDPYLIAECLVRPVLADRLIRNWYAQDPRFRFNNKNESNEDKWINEHFNDWWREVHSSVDISFSGENRILKYFNLPLLDSVCEGDEEKGWINSSLNSVPIERSGHTAVWTGSEMIIWGGYSTLRNILNSGARYSPATDSWMSISSGLNCPEGRILHTAIWTGTEMIIWGGESSESPWFPKSGGRYNPSRDAWTLTSTGTACPSGREGHTAIWTGTEMIVWGGANYNANNSGGRYDPASDSWTATSMDEGCPSPRQGHTAVWTGDEMIIWGGLLGSDPWETNSGGRYSPFTDSWTATSAGPDCPLARSGHTAIWTGMQMIVWGGSEPHASNQDKATGGLYDPLTDSWAAISTSSDCPTVVTDHTAIWTGEEMIVWGGGPRTNRNSGGRYNPFTNSWKPTSSDSNCPSARWLHTAVWTGDEMIVWGGSIGYYLDQGTCTGGRYSPQSDSWVPTSIGVESPSSRTDHLAEWTGSEMIIWGGQDLANNAWHALNDGARYILALDAWSSISESIRPEPFFYSTLIWTGKEMIVWGGSISQYGGSPVNTGARYNPTSDTWSPTSTSGACPSARAFHTAVWTGEEMIIWGGSDNSGGRYNPVLDSWLPTSIGDSCPEARYGHTAVWTGSEMIIWGGANDTMRPCLDSGSRYSPNTDTWKTVSIEAGTPSKRFLHSAIWTGYEMIIWGGDYFYYTGIEIPTANEAKYSGARYDPVSDAWTAILPPTKGMLGVVKHAAVWTGRAMMVWGGLYWDPDDVPIQYIDFGTAVNGGGWNAPQENYWTYTQTSGYCPSPRFGHSAVWTGNEMIIWGGEGGLYSGGIYRPYYAHERPVEKP